MERKRENAALVFLGARTTLDAEPPNAIHVIIWPPSRIRVKKVLTSFFLLCVTPSLFHQSCLFSDFYLCVSARLHQLSRHHAELPILVLNGLEDAKISAPQSTSLTLIHYVVGRRVLQLVVAPYPSFVIKPA